MCGQEEVRELRELRDVRRAVFEDGQMRGVRDVRQQWFVDVRDVRGMRINIPYVVVCFFTWGISNHRASVDGIRNQSPF